MGGAIAAIDYMKETLIAANAARVEAIEKGEQVLVGVNAYTETEPAPLSAGADGIITVPESVEIEQVAALQAWRQRRDDKAVRQALIELKSAAAEGRNIMEPSIAAAKAGVTTGEWGEVLREVFGEYRAPTGIHAKHADRHGEARRGASRARRRGVGQARPQAHLRGRQAWARRTFERRRADRRARDRCRHGGRL